MAEYPPRSHLTRWEIVEQGDKAHLRFVHEDRPESLIALQYRQLGETIALLISALVQSIAIRGQNRKELRSDGGPIPSQPIPAISFQMHIAQDKSHVRWEFQSPHGLPLQVSMAATQAEGIARKILNDLDSYPSPARRH